MKHGKKYQDSVKLIDHLNQYDPDQAAQLVVSTGKAKFDETVEVSIRLGVDPRHADQQVRGAVVLPHGTGRSIRVLVIAKGAKADEARAAGADYVGDQDMITKIQTEKSFEQLCYEHNIAGAILMGLRTNDPYCELLAKSKYPCVTIDIEVPGPNVSCVMMDDIKAFDELTQYLIDMGHRKIVVVHGRKLAMVSMQRLVGAYQAMQRNGLELPRDNIIYTNFGREEARDGVKEYFRTHSPDSATAFLCMSDMLAIGTIEGLKELGYKVPKDYSVVGFDGLEVTNYTDPAITTIDQNIQQKGYEATRLLCDMIRGKRKAQRLVLPHTLTVRDSVRPL